MTADLTDRRITCGRWSVITRRLSRCAVPDRLDRRGRKVMIWRMGSKLPRARSAYLAVPAEVDPAHFKETKPMDRPSGGLHARGLSLAAVLFFCCAQGCRSTHSEVPPGKPYQTTGGPPSSVGFSNEPHPSLATGMASLYGNKAPGSMTQDGRGDSSNPGGLMLGTPTQGPAALGTPTDNQYGPPGSSNSAGAGSSGGTTLGNALLRTIPSGSQMVAKDPDPVPPGSAGSAGGSYP